MSDNQPFDRPSRALLNSYSFTGIYFDHCTETTDDTGNYWTLLEIDIPHADRIIRHRFTRPTSQLISSRPVFLILLKRILWDMEVRDRACYFGVLSGLILEQNMYHLSMHPHTFTENLRLIYPTLPFRYVYYAMDMTFVEHANVHQLDLVEDDTDIDADDSNDVVTEE